MNPVRAHLLFALAGAMWLPSFAATIYVAPTGSDSTGSGTSAAPFRTVTKAVTGASAGSTISIAPGEYTEPGTVSISSALTLEGSGPAKALPSTTTQALPPRPPLVELCAKQPCITTAAADRVFEVTGAASDTVVFTNLAVVGPDRSASVGSSSFGMVVDGVDVDLNNVTIVAGVGGAGEKGTDGGSAGHNPSGGMGGVCQAPKQTYEPCPCIFGFNGKPAVDAQGNTVNGGYGGDVRQADCPKTPRWDISDQPPGWNGGDGNVGPNGAGGKPSKIDAFLFARTAGRIAMQPAVSGQGVTGVAGSGGGGGGPGGTQLYYYAVCSVVYAIGGRGGNGGSGGAAGTGGQGGGQGGGAFGLVVARATVKGSALNVYGGIGGIGGSGGQGGEGSPGAKGAAGHNGTNALYEPSCPTPPKYGGKGGQGGAGGHGGAGGGGAGGNGGPSIDIVLLGSDARLAGSLRVSTRGGEGGRGNIGGRAGTRGTTAASGQPGVQQTHATFPAP